MDPPAVFLVLEILRFSLNCLYDPLNGDFLLGDLDCLLGENVLWGDLENFLLGEYLLLGDLEYLLLGDFE